MQRSHEKAPDAGARLESILLLALLTVVAATTFATRYRGLLTEDAVMYALDILRLDRWGNAAWPTVFNGELSFGYYWLQLGLYRLSRSPEQLVAVLVAVNVLSSIMVLGLSLYLARRWFDRTVAFYAGLLLALAPAFWQLSRYGHPAMPALAAFLVSLAFLERWTTAADRRQWLAIGFVLTVIAAYALRLDTALLAGSYFALVLWRGRQVRRQWIQLALLWGAALAGYALLRLVALGYIITPDGGSVLLHIGRTAQHGSMLGNTVKNLALWAMGVNPLVAFAAVATLLGMMWRRRYRWIWFFLCWLLPVGALLPFYALDFSRIAMLSAPAIGMLAALLPAQIGVRKPAWGLAALVVAAQLVAVLAYPVAVRVYTPKTVYQGRHLAAAPLGSVVEDTWIRQRYLAERTRTAQQIATLEDHDVLIVGASNLMLYRFALVTMRDAWHEERTRVAGIPIGVIQTGQNRFYLFDADDCVGCRAPVAQLLAQLNSEAVAVHAAPFDTRFPAEGLLLNDIELAQWLQAGR